MEDDNLLNESEELRKKLDETMKKIEYLIKSWDEKKKTTLSKPFDNLTTEGKIIYLKDEIEELISRKNQDNQDETEENLRRKQNLITFLIEYLKGKS